MEIQTCEEYQYPTLDLKYYCESAASGIEQNLKMSILCRIQIGRLLNYVKDHLPYGDYGPWLAWRFPGWSDESTRGWRKLAETVDHEPELIENLQRFNSVTCATEFAQLPPAARDRIVALGAFDRPAFRAAVWEQAMREHLTDDRMDYARRHGDVLHAIEEARQDPHLQEAADRIYAENREAFARLASRSEEEMDVETGVRPKETPSSNGGLQAHVVEGEGDVWLCRRDDEGQFYGIAPVARSVLLWPGPVVLVAFPKTNDGPAAAAWQESAVDAVARRLHATTVQERYGTVL